MPEANQPIEALVSGGMVLTTDPEAIANFKAHPELGQMSNDWRVVLVECVGRNQYRVL